MYKIALICQFGASTGMFASKMKQAANQLNLEIEAQAYPDNKLDDLIENHDIIMFGPQVGFKKAEIEKRYPQYSYKLYIIDSMDFGMMNGGKVLNEIIKIIKENKDE